MELKSLSLGDWQNLKVEIAYLAMFGFPQKKADVTPIRFLYEELQITSLRTINKSSGGLGGWSGSVIGPYSLPTKEEILKFQKIVREQLNNLETKNFVEFDLKGVTLTCHRSKDGKKSWISFSYNRIQDALIAQLGRLIYPHIAKIRQCLECKNYFYPLRNTKKYCSAQCQNRVSKRKQIKRIKTKKRG